MRSKTCVGCGEQFRADARSYRARKQGRRSVQRFCSKLECRKASHRRSQNDYWKKDPQYRERHAISSRSWRRRNPDYWRRYRQTHPQSVKRNRDQQRRRDRMNLAKTDSINSFQYEKLERIGVLINLANTDSMNVPWTLVSEEIRLYLKWQMRLANTNSIAAGTVDNPESSA